MFGNLSSPQFGSSMPKPKMGASAGPLGSSNMPNKINSSMGSMQPMPNQSGSMGSKMMPMRGGM